MNDKKTVRICAEKKDKSSRFIDAYIGEYGEIGFLVQDLGWTPSGFPKPEEYEYATYVDAALKDQVVLALLKELFEGKPAAAEDFKTLMEKNGIPCQRFVI